MFAPRQSFASNEEIERQKRVWEVIQIDTASSNARVRSDESTTKYQIVSSTRPSLLLTTLETKAAAVKCQHPNVPPIVRAKIYKRLNEIFDMIRTSEYWKQTMLKAVEKTIGDNQTPTQWREEEKLDLAEAISAAVKNEEYVLLRVIEESRNVREEIRRVVEDTKIVYGDVVYLALRPPVLAYRPPPTINLTYAESLNNSICNYDERGIGTFNLTALSDVTLYDFERLCFENKVLYQYYKGTHFATYLFQNILYSLNATSVKDLEGNDRWQAKLAILISATNFNERLAINAFYDNVVVDNNSVSYDTSFVPKYDVRALKPISQPLTVKNILKNAVSTIVDDQIVSERIDDAASLIYRRTFDPKTTARVPKEYLPIFYVFPFKEGHIVEMDGKVSFVDFPPVNSRRFVNFTINQLPNVCNDGDVEGIIEEVSKTLTLNDAIAYALYDAKGLDEQGIVLLVLRQMVGSLLQIPGTRFQIPLPTVNQILSWTTLLCNEEADILNDDDDDNYSKHVTDEVENQMKRATVNDDDDDKVPSSCSFKKMKRSFPPAQSSTYRTKEIDRILLPSLSGCSASTNDRINVEVTRTVSLIRDIASSCVTALGATFRCSSYSLLEADMREVKKALNNDAERYVFATILLQQYPSNSIKRYRDSLKNVRFGSEPVAFYINAIPFNDASSSSSSSYNPQPKYPLNRRRYVDSTLQERLDSYTELLVRPTDASSNGFVNDSPNLACQPYDCWELYEFTDPRLNLLSKGYDVRGINDESKRFEYSDIVYEGIKNIFEQRSADDVSLNMSDLQLSAFVALQIIIPESMRPELKTTAQNANVVGETSCLRIIRDKINVQEAASSTSCALKLGLTPYKRPLIPIDTTQMTREHKIVTRSCNANKIEPSSIIDIPLAAYNTTTATTNINIDGAISSKTDGVSNENNVVLSCSLKRK